MLFSYVDELWWCLSGESRQGELIEGNLSWYHMGRRMRGSLRRQRQSPLPDAKVKWWVRVGQTLGITAAILGIGGLPDDITQWFEWLRSFDLNTWGLLILAIVSIITAPSAVRLWYERRRDRNRAMEEAKSQQRHVDSLTVSASIGRLIQPAIVHKPRLAIPITSQILEKFESTCPEGKAGEYEYDGALLSKWMNYNIAYLLTHNQNQLRRPPELDSKVKN